MRLGRADYFTATNVNPDAALGHSNARRRRRPVSKIMPKKVTFSDLMKSDPPPKETKSPVSKTGPNSLILPMYSFEDTSSDSSVNSRSRIPSYVELSSVIPSRTVYVPSISTISDTVSSYTTEVVPFISEYFASSVSIPLVSSTYDRAIKQHKPTILPSQTISLPPLTAMLFAQTVPETHEPDYGHPDFKENRTNVLSTPNSSRSVKFSVNSLGSSDVKKVSESIKIQQNPRVTSRSSIPVVGPTLTRQARHNTQSPYSYRDMQGKNQVSTNSRSRGSFASRERPNHDREEEDQEDHSTTRERPDSLGKSNVHTHHPQSSNINEDEFEDMYDSSGYSILPSGKFEDTTLE